MDSDRFPFFLPTGSSSLEPAGFSPAEERFGKLRLLSLEWKSTKPAPLELTTWRRSLILDRVDVLYLLGVGDGGPYFHLKDWLQEKPERRLVFLEKQKGVIASIFEENHPLLADPQVDLEWFESKETFSQLTERYPSEHVEVAALPGVNGAKTRLEILRKATISSAYQTELLHGYVLFQNFILNAPRLKGAFYANGLRNRFANVPAIICGAGPSLEEAIPFLKQADEKALIIAGGSAIGALSAHGIAPHFGVAVDPNPEERFRFQNAAPFAAPLLFSTRLHPDVFSACKGPLGYIHSSIGGSTGFWLQEQLNLSDPPIGNDLSPEALSVTTISLAIAQYFGCTEILLAGTDLAYTRGKRYANGVGAESIPLDQIGDRLLWRKDKQGNRVQTAIRWIMESAAISDYARRHPEITWIDTTPAGLPIPGFTRMPLDQALFRHSQQNDLRGRIARAIALNPMPDPTPKLAQLKASLERLIAHLEILSGEKKGSKALAECDLEEELAASILFCEIGTLQNRLCPEKRWPFYLDQARKYLIRFDLE